MLGLEESKVGKRCVWDSFCIDGSWFFIVGFGMCWIVSYRFFHVQVFP